MEGNQGNMYIGRTGDNYTQFRNAYKNYCSKFAGDKNTSEYAWEHCYEAFGRYIGKSEDNIDYDYLSLHLAAYLANWGMYRNSFLMKKDYKIHENAIREILKPEYSVLRGARITEIEANKSLLKGLANELKKYYRGIRDTVDEGIKPDVSSILITKILLGTLGCIPAFDSYFTKGFNEITGSNLGELNDKTIDRMVEYCKDYEGILEKIKGEGGYDKAKDYYPIMKVLDMVVWQIGYGG